MDPGTRALLEEHERRFDAAVEHGDFGPLVDLFADDAEPSFTGLPVGPFVGHTAIAAAYEAQPPDDGLDVVDISEDADGAIVERFEWHRGGGGTMRLVVDRGKITRLVVSFD